MIIFIDESGTHQQDGKSTIVLVYVGVDNREAHAEHVAYEEPQGKAAPLFNVSNHRNGVLLLFTLPFRRASPTLTPIPSLRAFSQLARKPVVGGRVGERETGSAK